MTGRTLICQVPFCRRSTSRPKPYWDEWLCAQHYKLVDKRLKNLRSAAWRRRRYQLDRWLWREAKRQAIERALGTGVGLS